MTKTYEIRGYGNYSHDYGWDNGLMFSDPEETDEEFIQDDIMFMGRYVKETYANEHGGSRTVSLLVQADDIYEALNYAYIWAGHYYPEKRMGD